MPFVGRKTRSKCATDIFFVSNESWKRVRNVVIKLRYPDMAIFGQVVSIFTICLDQFNDLPILQLKTNSDLKINKTVARLSFSFKSHFIFLSKEKHLPKMAQIGVPNAEPGDTGKMMKLMYEMESAAEDILTDRQQIIDLDRKRQKTREAVRY